MPIYEYECRKCGIHFDKLQRFGEADPETCPRGHRQVHRLLG
ncbi:MAG: zinc ribbon domain-containing protein, partial [Chloroflexi bacterium]